jgi:hypothetical protein
MDARSHEFSMMMTARIADAGCGTDIESRAAGVVSFCAGDLVRRWWVRLGRWGEPWKSG